jgi:type II secretory pathway component HofQ
MDPVSKAERYLRQAEECIALAKAATSNKIRAHHYATADRYLRLAEAEPTVTNPDALSDRGQIPVAPSATT